MTTGCVEMKYRMYVDEVGNPDLSSSANPLHRYLSLTGVIMELGYVDAVAHPKLEGMKRSYFGSHVDDPVILHRKELLRSRAPFNSLSAPETRSRFDAELLRLLGELEYSVVTVVMDKRAHLDRYRVWRADAYHYCTEVLLERYVMWLAARDARGDVMAESRGGKEDRRLKDSFARLCAEGTAQITSDDLLRHLTSRQLKVKPKSNNITGLQIADVVAHPSFKAAQAARDGEALPDNFGGRIAAILEDSKYRRSPTGRIEGWGRKWLP